MDFNSLKLIDFDESKELFLYQTSIIQKLKNKEDANNILRLSILQTLSPIEDFGSAEKIINAYFYEHKDFNLCVIGSYLRSKWCFDIENDIYLEYLKSTYDSYNNKSKAIIQYLIALNLLKNNDDNNGVIQHLTIALSLFKDFNNCKILLCILTNKEGFFDIDDLDSFSKGDVSSITLDQLTDPEEFIKEFIIR